MLAAANRNAAPPVMTIGSIRSSAVFGVVFVLLLLLPLEEVLPVVVFEVEEDEELFLVVVVVVIVVVVHTEVVNFKAGNVNVFSVRFGVPGIHDGRS